MASIPMQRQPQTSKRGRRLAAGLTALAASISIGVATFGPDASAAPAPQPVASGADWGEFGAGLTLGGATIGCIAAPTPWSCVAAGGSGISYMDKSGTSRCTGTRT